MSTKSRPSEERSPVSKNSNEESRHKEPAMPGLSHNAGPRPRRLNRLQLRGLSISSQHGHVRRVEADRYLVRSQSHRGWYDVAWNGRRWACQCKFNVKNHIACKHIYAVTYTLGRTDDATVQGASQCPSCKSSETVTKRGVFKNKSGPVQCYRCRICRIRFFPATDFNVIQYVAAIWPSDLLLVGLGLREISDSARDLSRSGNQTLRQDRASEEAHT